MSLSVMMMDRLGMASGAVTSKDPEEARLVLLEKPCRRRPAGKVWADEQGRRGLIKWLQSTVSSKPTLRDWFSQ